MTTPLKKIVIVGGGAGGLEMATQLGHKLGRKKKAKITLVDRNHSHLWKPLLHEVATGSLDEGVDALSYLAHARNHGFQFQLGSVIDIDREAKTITIAELRDEKGELLVPERKIAYDTLVMALGSTSNDFNTPGVKENCIFLDNPHQARRFHQEMLNLFLKYSANLGANGKVNIAIVGGGATGGIAQAFALDKMQMGWIFSAGILGLLPGALVGGMLADRYGRKRILIGSVALFGLFSLATAIAWDFPSLVFARLMTGVGLGAALPNLIALTSEAAGPRFRGTAVSLMYCGVPIGAALAATLGFAGANLAWQTVFWVGGVVPLILVPLLMRWLPESAVFAGEKQSAPPLRALFAPETATATLLLWLCYFFTLLVVYMLINWLPLLLVEQGFQPSQAAGVMFALQMGAASGTLMLGALMDKLRPVTMSLLIYSGMLASLLALGTVSSFNGMLLAGFVAGLFATGGQSVLYALAPLFYSSQIRATGVGTAVAVGRLGAMSGPLLAGKMLALGTGTVGVMAASAPGILVAGLAVFILMSRRSRIQPCADA